MEDPAGAQFPETFKRWCSDLCLCLNSEAVTAIANVTRIRQEQMARDATPYTGSNLPIQPLNVPNFPGFSGTFNTASGGGNDMFTMESCNGTCTAGQDCGAAGEECSCMVLSSTYIPRLGIEKYVSACTVPWVSKRDLNVEEPLCPCNTSYVSQSCCHSREGMVWEDESFKMGELWVEDEL